jgi:DNA-directed RNA polymerase specialized sigma24 family protein
VSEYWAAAREVLTDKQFRILELRDRHGFSLRQIAHATGVGVPTVRSSLAAARHKLNLALKEPA